MMGTWWIEEGVLLGSSNPSDADLEQLYRDGFRVVISLLDENEQPPRYDVAHASALGFARHSVPVRDFHPPTVQQLEQFARLADAARTLGKVVVHCEGGAGRTGTMAAAYWIDRGRSIPDAIAKIRRAKPHAIETDEQRAALEEFARSKKRGTESSDDSAQHSSPTSVVPSLLH